MLSSVQKKADAQPDAGDASPARPEIWQPAPTADRLVNALTCDVEDYFQVSAFESAVPKARWNDLECRIPRNVDCVLQLLADAGVKGTFFTLGWVAERFPQLVRRIADEGHEVASHGMRHIRIWTQDPEAFRNDAWSARRLLEDTSGTAVLGYRAASWSLDARTPWAHRILEEAGYRYSSSIYPITHDHYGMPEAPAVPFYPPSTEILEIPATTAYFLGRNWPAAGGGYFRLLPFGASLRLLKRARATRSVPAVFYFHPWELDPGQPRISGADVKSRFRHYVNLGKTEPRLRALLAALPWDRMDRVFSRDGPQKESASRDG